MRSTLRSPAGRAALALAVVGVALVAWWLARPLFVDEVVDEAFPLSAGAEVPDGMTQEDVEAEMAAAAAAPPTEVTDPMPEVTSPDAPAATATTAPAPAPTPVALLRGAVTGADERHSGTGSATLYELPDGARILRFEAFEVTNGPDLRVYLAPLGADGTPQVDAGVELGPLKGNVGDQNYDVPADLDLSQPLAVVIWCEPFSVTFATASLTAP
jgi:hypothetical protein